MHYYERNIGDYHRKAGRLNILQHGVYNLLIDACYDRERFPESVDEAIDWVWAETDDEIDAVKFVIKKFFKLEDGFYVQNHIKEDLEKYKANDTKKVSGVEKEGNKARQQRHREERQQLFAQLKEYGVTPPFNTKVTDLRVLLDDVTTNINANVTDNNVTNNANVTASNANVTASNGTVTASNGTVTAVVTANHRTIEPSNQEPSNHLTKVDGDERKIFEFVPVARRQSVPYMIHDSEPINFETLCTRYQTEQHFKSQASLAFPNFAPGQVDLIYSEFERYWLTKFGRQQNPQDWMNAWITRLEKREYEPAFTPKTKSTIPKNDAPPSRNVNDSWDPIPEYEPVTEDNTDYGDMI